MGAKVLEDVGIVCGTDSNVEPGGARVKLLVPGRSASSILGPDGDMIRQLQPVTGLTMHVDPLSSSMNGGDLAEQIISLSGPLPGVQAALPLIAEHVVAFVGERWFPAWAALSNCQASMGGMSGHHAASPAHLVGPPIFTPPPL